MIGTMSESSLVDGRSFIRIKGKVLDGIDTMYSKPAS